jgi:hypothetical protein
LSSPLGSLDACEVADALGDVHGVVAEAFVEAPDQGGLQGVGQGEVALAQLFDELVV